MATDPSSFPDNSRLQARDWRTILLWLLAAVLGVVIATRYFFVAFPEAALDLRVSRPEALATARSFLTSSAVAPQTRIAESQSAIVFGHDDDARVFLERQLGLAEANRLMTSEVNVWHWNARFFRDRQKEEFTVEVDPGGRIVAFDHILPEAAPGARLERDAAFEIARAFVATRLHVNLGGFNFLQEETSSADRPNRRDWSFTWERRDFRAADAPYRLRFTLHGDQPGSFDEFLKVPEAWTRDYERLRSSNLFWQSLGQFPFFLLLGAMLYALYVLARRELVQWKDALKIGLVVAILFFASNVNEWPITRATYNTNTDYQGFFFEQMVFALLTALGSALLVFLGYAAGEPLYRRLQPGELRLGRAFSLPGIRSKEFLRSCVVGLCMAAAHLGFVILFYVFTKNFGFWVPQEVKYTDAVSTAIPWISPLAIAILAATTEEFIFRLFAIPFLLRFTRSRVIAVVLPAFVWGFLHSTYPVQPGYARGLEVGLIGVVAGIVMLRYGILATLVWHYTVDALLIGLFLIRSESLYFKLSGVFVAFVTVLPLLFAVVSYLRTRRFASDPQLFNSSEPVPDPFDRAEITPQAAAEDSAQAVTVSRPVARNIWLALVFGVVGIVALVAVKAPRIGDYNRAEINRSQASEFAGGILHPRGMDPSSWQQVVTFVTTYDPEANEYLRRQLGVAGANNFYKANVPAAFWRVRYFRDGQKEEYAVILKLDGSLHSVHHALDEKTPGPSLSQDQARAIVETYLLESKQLDFSRWKPVSYEAEKKPARTDHRFEWENVETVGEAHVRIEARVIGNEPSGYRTYVKVPEEWERKLTERSLLSTLYLVAQILIFASVVAGVLIAFFKNLKSPALASVRWKRVAFWAVFPTLAFLVNTTNALPLFLENYATEMPYKTYLAILVLAMLVLIALLFGAFVLLFGFAWFFIAKVFQPSPFPSWRGLAPSDYRDAFLLAIGGTGILLGLSRVPTLLDRILPAAKSGFPADTPNLIPLLLPASSAAASALSTGMLAVGAVGLAAGYLAGFLRSTLLRFGCFLFLAAALTSAPTSAGPLDFFKRFLISLIPLLVVWWGVSRVVRFNTQAYILIAALVTLIPSAAELCTQPNAFFRWNGYAVIAVSIGLLLWPLIGWLRASSRSRLSSV